MVASVLSGKSVTLVLSNGQKTMPKWGENLTSGP